MTCIFPTNVSLPIPQPNPTLTPAATEKFVCLKIEKYYPLWVIFKMITILYMSSIICMTDALPHPKYQ